MALDERNVVSIINTSTANMMEHGKLPKVRRVKSAISDSKREVNVILTCFPLALSFSDDSADEDM